MNAKCERQTSNAKRKRQTPNAKRKRQTPTKKVDLFPRRSGKPESRSSAARQKQVLAQTSGESFST